MTASCHTCLYRQYKPQDVAASPHILPEISARAAVNSPTPPRNLHFVDLVCVLNPVPVPTQPTSFCGQFRPR